MSTYSIVNTEIKDLDFIYNLFDEAISYQKSKGYPAWAGYDKDVLKKDIADKLQYKVLIENDIACVFSICYSDEIIWREMERGDALYLHRIVVNPAHKGQYQFQKVFNWAVTHAAKRKLKYIRMDTWEHNPNLVSYYETFGFMTVGKFKTPDSIELPMQQRNINIVLLEYDPSTGSR